MSDTGIKVRVFDMKNGLVEYENVKTIRIISKDYNLLIMKDYLSVIGEIVGSVDIKGEVLESYPGIKSNDVYIYDIRFGFDTSIMCGR